MSTQFGERCRRCARITRATMCIQHNPGDAMQADWAGDSISVQDPVTGEQSAAYLFVAILPCSYYCTSVWKTAYISGYGTVRRCKNLAGRSSIPSTLCSISDLVNALAGSLLMRPSSSKCCTSLDNPPSLKIFSADRSLPTYRKTGSWQHRPVCAVVFDEVWFGGYCFRSISIDTPITYFHIISRQIFLK